MWLTVRKGLRFYCIGAAIFILVYTALRSCSPTTTTAPLERPIGNEAANAVYDVVTSLPYFRKSVDCDAIFDNDTTAMEQARRWSFDGYAFWKSALDRDRGHTLRCHTIRQTFAFADRPLTEEERMFPLAYGLLVHANEVQVFFLLSALYQPQNAYCIAVDGKSSERFKRRISLLADCFPNIHVVGIGDVQWASYEIVTGVFTCLRHLAALDHAWKYYQRSGVDLPLKTNIETVRIFKQFNGSSNVEVIPVRVPPEVLNKTKPPLTVWKSGMPGVFSREAANTMVRSEKVRDHLEFIKLIDFPDEKLWASILGNPKELPMPGGFDAHALNAKIQADQKRVKVSDVEPATTSANEPFALQRYWIGWYQKWAYGDTCQGRWVHSSCVFGVGDLPVLIRRAELAAHKLYLDTQPAAFFCLYERIRLRAFDDAQRRFRGEAYARLPHVQLHNGVHIDNVQTIFP